MSTVTAAVTASHDQPKPTCARAEREPDVNSSSHATKAHVDTWKIAAPILKLSMNQPVDEKIGLSCAQRHRDNSAEQYTTTHDSTR
jgi:hypothetical protein